MTVAVEVLMGRTRDHRSTVFSVSDDKGGGMERWRITVSLQPRAVTGFPLGWNTSGCCNRELMGQKKKARVSFEGRLGFLYHPSYQWAIRVSQSRPFGIGCYSIWGSSDCRVFYLTSVYILPLQNDSVAVILAGSGWTLHARFIPRNYHVRLWKPRSVQML